MLKKNSSKTREKKRAKQREKEREGGGTKEGGGGGWMDGWMGSSVWTMVGGDERERGYVCVFVCLCG